MDGVPYDPTFFAHHEEGSRRSARAAIPLVIELVRPASIVDVGCGTGAWLAECQAAGISDYLGIDGSYIDRAKLLIEPERFVAHDLAQPIRLDRRFDLALCLEVAEHLPEERAESFIASLTALAHVVLFSAAIPHQGGNDHVNEQWPEYWQDQFARRNYVVIDCLRERLWRHKDVVAWYAQNLLLFVERGRLGEYPLLARLFEQAGENPRLSLVHPDHYLGLYQHLSRELFEASRVALQATLKLREINLVAFPDWTLQQDVIVDQLQALFSAVLTHPSSRSIVLIVYFSGEAAANLLTRLARETLVPGGVPIAGAPLISGVNESFGAAQWLVLQSCLQFRVVLPREDTRTIAAVGGDSIKPLPLGDLQSKQVFPHQ